MSAPFIPVEPYLDNEADDDEAQTDNQRLEALVTTETKRFNEALRTAPTNVSLWIKYMAAQEREGAFVRNKHKQRSVVLEKQYSILEKAKAANPTSVELQQITWLMALTVPDELPHKLEQHLHVAPDSELLWLLLIQQTQEQFSAFSLPKMRNLYARVIQTLQASTADVSATLLLFFTLLCTLEAKSGYTERAVGLMQALMEFNCNMPSSLCSTHVEFDQRKKDFQVFWDQDLPRFGEAGHVAWASWQNQSELKSTVPTVDPSYASQLLPSMHSYMTMLETHVEDEVAAMQPPLHLKEVDPARHRGPDDKASDTLNPQGHGVHHHESHDTREEGDEYVWSNLHGYRIPIQDAQDTAEYERILHELKSNRPVAPVQKKAKNDATMALIADHDERLGAHVVPNNDPHVQLLKEESLLHATQWSPLHPRNPDHAPLIEAQPDRVLLFDEIQPFLFHVPAVWHRELLLSHLGLVGVNVRGRLSLQALQWLYQDDVASNSIVATCFRTFQGHSPPPCDRLALLHTVLHDSLTVSRDTLHDPSKVMHVRHLLWQMREHALLMEFETHLALHLNSPDAPRALAKSLLATAPTDMALWEQYAAMEWRLQNVKQVVRICDKTIESLPSTSLEQHRFLFLRFRAELMDATVLWTSRAVWRCVYLVAKAFYPENANESLAKVCKKRDKNGDSDFASIVSPSLQRQVRLRLQQQMDHAMATHTTTTRPVLQYVVYTHAMVVHAMEGFAVASKHFRKAIDVARSNCRDQPRMLEPNAWRATLEWLLAAYLEFLQLAGTCSPRQWRHVTQLAMQLVPEHPVFAHLFVDAEQKNSMSQQVRRAVQDAVTASRLRFDAASPMAHVMGLLGEVYRLKRFNELDVADTCCALHQWGPVAISRIRRVFEDALDSVSWRSHGSALLWRLYLRFEVQAGQVQGAIKVFYRGIHTCPWSKELYLDSVRVLRPYLSDDDMAEIVGFLVGKELYLRYEGDGTA
ncbi:hypothetical protein, variant [Aphanomyces invadans]|nr:hypothetical protein, variant [Aphanomyces invadans]ETW03057.1 hypothetical protein, variant [Aphanomyces invadans]|eukprot:XP_008868441.1 hypothetical protein, variant [Aphanomyces invadans]